MVRRWFLLLALLGLIAACTTPPETDGLLEANSSITVTLPPASSVLLTLHASGDTRVYARSQNPEGVGLRIVLFNEDLSPMIASASHTWFGIPSVALANGKPEPLIQVEPLDGPRFNFHFSRAYDYYLKVENFSDQWVEAEVGAFAFEPLRDADLVPMTGGSRTGALEFLGEVDTYIIGKDGTLSLSAGGSGYAWIVADVYTSNETGSSKVKTLEPGNAYPVKGGDYIWVHARGHVAAGFNEPESFQYTLTLNVAQP